MAGQSEFISRELPVALMNKYFEYQTQLCHDAEGAPDTESWERAHSFPDHLILRGYVGAACPQAACRAEKTFRGTPRGVGPALARKASS